jgi:hypothetical protein
MSGVAGDQRRPRIHQGGGGAADVPDGLGGHVRPPVGRHQHDVGVGRSHCLQQPVGHRAAEVGEGGPRSVLAGGEVGRMVGDPHHGDPQPAGGQHGGPAGLLEVGAGTDHSDTGVGQVLQGVQQGVEAVVQGVVVGQGDTVHSEQDQQLDRSGWGAEEERLARSVPGPPALGDAALQIEHDQISLTHGGEDLRRNQGLRRCRCQGPADTPTQHGVPSQRHRDGHRPPGSLVDTP